VNIEVVSTPPKVKIKLTKISDVKRVASYGFTVQIGAYSSYENASKCKLEAQKKLSEEVFIEIESSYYKVRVGRYTERVDAETARGKIRNIYPDAFIVKKK
jgi:cell division septation protein DedD